MTAIDAVNYLRPLGVIKHLVKHVVEPVVVHDIS